METWVTGVTLAYLLLLSLLLRERRGEAPRPELLLLGLGLVAQVAGDALYNAASLTGAYYTGHPLDGLWTFDVALFVLAARVSLAPRHFEAKVERGGRLARPFERPSGRHPAYLALAAGCGLLLLTETDPAAHNTLGGRGVLYGSVLLTLVVVLRQLLAFSENWRLAERLAGQGADLRALSAIPEVKVQSARRS